MIFGSLCDFFWKPHELNFDDDDGREIYWRCEDRWVGIVGARLGARLMERFRYQFFRGYLYRLSTPPHPRRQAPALFFLGNLKFRCCMCHVYKSTTITTTLNRNFSQKYPSFPPNKPSYPLPTTSPSHPALSLSSPLGPPPSSFNNFFSFFCWIHYTSSTSILLPHISQSLPFSLTFLNPFPQTRPYPPHIYIKTQPGLSQNNFSTSSFAPSTPRRRERERERGENR